LSPGVPSIVRTLHNGWESTDVHLDNKTASPKML
jgi:hypothetical protein